MSQEERGELITEINLRVNYAIAYLENLKDEELQSLSNQLSRSEDHA